MDRSNSHGFNHSVIRNVITGLLSRGIPDKPGGDTSTDGNLKKSLLRGPRQDIHTPNQNVKRPVFWHSPCAPPSL